MSLDGEMHGHVHAHKTGHHWIDMTVALSAVLISLVSLGVGILHGRTMEEMAEANHRLVSANSWPFLSYGAGVVTVAGVPTINLHVTNAGVGPAKIEAAELLWRGVAQRTNRDLLKACCDVDLVPGQFDSNVFLNFVMPTGQQVEFLGLKQTTNPAAFAALQKAMISRDLQLVVCYCSIFDECWKADLTAFSLKPAPADRCEQPAVPFDDGLMQTRG